MELVNIIKTGNLTQDISNGMENELFEDFELAFNIIEYIKKKDIHAILENIIITDQILDIFNEVRCCSFKYSNIFYDSKNEKVSFIYNVVKLMNPIINTKTIKHVSKWKDKDRICEFIIDNITEENYNLFESNLYKTYFKDCLYKLIVGYSKFRIILKIVSNYPNLLKSYLSHRNINDVILTVRMTNKILFTDLYFINISHQKLPELYKYINPETSKMWEKIFCMFCENGNLEEAKDVLEKSGIDSSCNGCYPFIKSLEAGQLEVAKWLYSLKKYELTVHNYMLLKNLAFFGMYETFIWLINKIGYIEIKHLKDLEKSCIDGERLGNKCGYESKYEVKLRDSSLLGVIYENQIVKDTKKHKRILTIIKNRLN